MNVHYATSMITFALRPRLGLIVRSGWWRLTNENGYYMFKASLILAVRKNVMGHMRPRRLQLPLL